MRASHEGRPNSRSQPVEATASTSPTVSWQESISILAPRHPLSRLSGPAGSLLGPSRDGNANRAWKRLEFDSVGQVLVVPFGDRWPDASEGSIGIRRPPRGDLPRSCRRAGGSATPVATEGRGGTDRNAESHWDTRWTKRAMNCGKEADMAGKVIVAVVVIAVIMAAVVMVSRQRKTQQARRAESLRSEAGEQSSLVRQREGKAAEVDALARAAQAESDAKAAEAKRLALTAERQKAEASKQRSEVDDQFHKADEIDPHYDNTHVEDGNTTDGTGHTHQADTSSTEDKDRETPR